VLGVAALILLVTAVAWPVGAIVRRVRARRQGTGRLRPERAGRTARILTRVAAVSTVLALGGWAASVLTVMSLEEVPEFSLRQLQVLQGLGVLGIVPAVLQVVGAVRRRQGWLKVLGAVLVLVALVGAAWFAFEFRLLAPSVSY
jgi:hypothetical protein